MGKASGEDLDAIEIRAAGGLKHSNYSFLYTVELGVSNKDKRRHWIMFKRAH